MEELTSSKINLIKKSIINTSLGSEINELMRLCFSANSICDVIAQRLDIQFSMPKASETFHLKIAHSFPGDLFGDGIVHYLNLRNFPVFYGNVSKYDFYYENISEYFSEFVNIMYDIDKQCSKASDLADQIKDFSAVDFLGSLQSTNIALYIKQAFILYDASNQNNNLVAFNNQFDSLIIV